MDSFSDRAEGGGLNSVAQGVADRHPRDSGMDAVREIPQSYSPYNQGWPRDNYNPHAPQQPPSRLPMSDRNSYGSSFALAAGAATPGTITPTGSPAPRSDRFSGRSIPLEDYHSNPNHPMAYSGYQDSPYQNSYNPSMNSSNIMHQASINPNNIVDDGDDFPAQRNGSGAGSNDKTLAGSAAAAGGAGVLGGLFGRKGRNHTPSGTYDAVGAGAKAEKSAWLASQTKGKRKMRWWVGVAIGAVIVLAIVGGIVGGVLGTRNSDGGGSSGSGSTNNAGDDTSTNGDLDLNSAEIKALMNNKNLHKVFPGMDYTPWGTQYPLCHTYPPSQNNVTRDMAVLAQLTNVVRLYGTDCNQTEMVLHAIDRLQLKDMKVWMGVWIDTNQTTSDRQLAQMYKILEDTKDPASIFKGVIVGNEALYRAGEEKSQSEAELIDILTHVKSNFSAKGYDLPVATSDLGDNWNAQLVTAVDYVMSNIHPFFAGVTADVAAGWTWDFWQGHDVILTQGMPDVKQVISETGWPSGGGTDCGGTDGSCTPGQSGAVASVDGMNTFMDNWVCQALENGTDYFW
jgi:exo-beta-1,3-glucanase (GH17 family)